MTFLLAKSKDFDIIALSTKSKEKLMQKRFIVKPVKIEYTVVKKVECC